MNMHKHYYLKNVVTLQLDVAKCTGCGMCAIVCPHGVFKVSNGKATIMDLEACMECGACAKNCPVQAISVQAGVGCAQAVIQGKLKGTAPCCGPADGKSGCCG